MSKNNLNQIFEFLSIAKKLKSTRRYLHLTSGRRESSAEHSWRLALMVFILNDELNLNLNAQRAIEVALVHDLAEAITGDIDAVKIAEEKISKQKKENLELDAIEEIKKSLPEKTAQKIHDLWYEYNNNKTREAKFVKAVDKIETLTQIAESGFKYFDKPEIITNYADEAVNNFPELLPVLEIIKNKLKNEFIKGGFDWQD